MLKNILQLFIIVFLILTSGFARAKHKDNFIISRTPQNIKVAIYNNGTQFDKYGIRYIYEALQIQDSISVNIIKNLKSSTLKKFDVVVISTITSLSVEDSGDADRGIKGTDWIKTLINYVDSGGGLVLGHNAISYKGTLGSYKLFPMIGIGTGKSMNTNYSIRDLSCSVMKEIPAKFKHAYDHITITPGENGKVIAVDGDNKALIVIGDVSRGRVAEIGYPMGLYWKGRTGTLPKIERKILINIIKWAGKKTKFNVPLTHTEDNLLAQIQKYNQNVRQEAMKRYKDLPSPSFVEKSIWIPSYWLVSQNRKERKPMNNPEVIAKIIENCKRMGFNKINASAAAGFLLYPSDAFPNEEQRACQNGFSPLGNIMKEARKRNMKVSVSIFPFRISRDRNGYQANISRKEYDEYINTGKLILKDKKWALSCCPDHPKVRERGLKLAEEIIKKYHPHGIYLDGIRYKDGYQTSCFCEYSQKQKAKFAKAHPEIPASQINKKFAEESIVSFAHEFVKRCKKLDPKIDVSCYTISSPSCKAPPWVNRFPVDKHAKYVSRYQSGPESSLKDIQKFTKLYNKWIKSANRECKFSPIIGDYDNKPPGRLSTEFKIVSDTLAKQGRKNKCVEFWSYNILIKDLDTHTIDEEKAKAISKVLGGTW